MLKLKVCGIKTAENYQALLDVVPDFVGLNFYKPSSRYVDGKASFNKDESVRLVGVFVNEKVDRILEIVENYQLDFIQLHGKEDAEYCRELSERGMKLIKAFQVTDDFNFFDLEPYLPYCEYFLFDAAGKHPGGNGYVFNWEVLAHYPYNKGYFLAGGLSPVNVSKALSLRYEQLIALDVNSGFETAPGIKDIKKIKELKEIL